MIELAVVQGHSGRGGDCPANRFCDERTSDASSHPTLPSVCRRRQATGEQPANGECGHPPPTLDQPLLLGVPDASIVPHEQGIIIASAANTIGAFQRNRAAGPTQRTQLRAQ